MSAAAMRHNERTMKLVYFDSETFSEIDIKKAGGFRYVTDPSTQMIMGQFAVDDGPVKVYDYYDESTHHLLDELKALAEDRDTRWVFWNSPFDRNVLRYTQGIEIPIERTIDAMVIAYSVSLPGQLGMAGTAVNLAQDEIKLSGKNPINTFCRPAPKNHKVDRYTPKEKPELWQAFIEYGIRDVETLRTIYKRLPKGNHTGIERTLWELDTRINERGVRVDLDLVHAALRAIEAEKTRLNARVAELTGGAIGAASQRDRLREYLIDLGADLPDLTAATVEAALKNKALPEVAIELLQIRQQISKASTAKYQTILAAHDANDHRLRGMLQINGASRTGRYSGRLVQLQNLPRPKMKGDAIEKALPLIKASREREITDNVMQLCSDLIRSVLVPAPGNKFVCVDLSNIEGRVLPWLAGEDTKLEAFREYDAGRGEDIYKVSYANAFGVDPKDVNADQRQLGKACIAEGELVLTDQGLVPIERVTTAMKVWDGVDWVNHTGVIYNGEKDVIEYDGLRATADHEIWTESGRNIQFGQCASEQERLLQTGFGRTPIRGMGDCVARRYMERRDRQTRAFEEVQTRPGGVPRLWGRAIGRFAKLAKWYVSWMLEMRTEALGPEVAVQTAHCGAGPMHKPKQPTLQELWRTWNRVPLPECQRSVPVRYDTLRSRKGQADRPRRQQRALHTGQYSFSDRVIKHAEHTEKCAERRDYGLGTNEKPLCGPYNWAKAQIGADARTGCSRCDLGSQREAQSVANDSRQTSRTRVYDITNAGPRHRYTVSGKLVSNCELGLGYSGGVGAFAAMANTFRIDLQGIVDPVLSAAEANIIERSERSLKWAQDHHKTHDLSGDVYTACSVLKHAWRDAHPNIVGYWKAIDEATKNAINRPGKWFDAGRTTFCYGRTKFGSALIMRLPSGRSIYYHAPKWKPPKKGEEEFGDRLTFMGIEQSKWKRLHTYSGSICENATQATARDVMMHTFPLIEAYGYPIVLSVHDEVLTETPDDSRYNEPELAALLATNPPWAESLPLAAAGWEGYFYRK